MRKTFLAVTALMLLTGTASAADWTCDNSKPWFNRCTRIGDGDNVARAEHAREEADQVARQLAEARKKAEAAQAAASKYSTTGPNGEGSVGNAPESTMRN